jgi:hypothetical protein
MTGCCCDALECKTLSGFFTNADETDDAGRSQRSGRQQIRRQADGIVNTEIAGNQAHKQESLYGFHAGWEKSLQ